jgi:hypothetical protein
LPPRGCHYLRGRGSARRTVHQPALYHSEPGLAYPGIGTAAVLVRRQDNAISRQMSGPSATAGFDSGGLFDSGGSNSGGSAAMASPASSIRHSASLGPAMHSAGAHQPPHVYHAQSSPPRGRKQVVSTVHSTRTIPLFTLTQFPRGVILHLGGVVKACSIKLCDNDALETRDSWWSELREEVRSHAQTLGYTTVVGYDTAAPPS